MSWLPPGRASTCHCRSTADNLRRRRRRCRPSSALRAVPAARLGVAAVVVHTAAAQVGTSSPRPCRRRRLSTVSVRRSNWWLADVCSSLAAAAPSWRASSDITQRSRQVRSYTYWQLVVFVTYDMITVITLIAGGPNQITGKAESYFMKFNRTLPQIFHKFD